MTVFTFCAIHSSFFFVCSAACRVRIKLFFRPTILLVRCCSMCDVCGVCGLLWPASPRLGCLFLVICLSLCRLPLYENSSKTFSFLLCCFSWWFFTIVVCLLFCCSVVWLAKNELHSFQFQLPVNFLFISICCCYCNGPTDYYSVPMQICAGQKRTMCYGIYNWRRAVSSSIYANVGISNCV